MNVTPLLFPDNDNNDIVAWFSKTDLVRNNMNNWST